MQKRSMIPFLCAVPAVGIGSLVMHLQGVAPLIYGQNIAALVLGGIVSILCLSVPRRLNPRDSRYLLFLSLCGLCCSFAFSGIGGVHRWIEIGPLSLNAAFIFLPIALIAMDGLLTEGKQSPLLGAFVVIAGILFLQPDASMVTAFTMAVTPMVFLRGQFRKPWAVGFVLLLLLTILAWIKSDSLEPVDYVEGILGMARDCGQFYWLAGVVSLLVLFVPFAIGAAKQERRAFCVGGAMFYLGALLSSAIGAYPVPVMGYGVSPIIGYLILASYGCRSAQAENPTH